MGKSKYTGEVNIQNGPHGQGTAVSEKGSRFVGTYKDGSFAKGKMVTASGALRYEGECSGGMPHGMGTWSDGVVETGRFVGGVLFDGTRTSPDGTVKKIALRTNLKTDN